MSHQETDRESLRSESSSKELRTLVSSRTRGFGDGDDDRSYFSMSPPSASPSARRRGTHQGSATSRSRSTEMRDISGSKNPIHPSSESDLHSHTTDQDEDIDGNSMGASEKKNTVLIESMDFEDLETYAWRLHQTRRFYIDIGHWWTATRRATVWKWTLTIAIGFFVGLIGIFVKYVTEILSDIKFKATLALYDSKSAWDAYFALIFFSIFYALVASFLCIMEPGAAGSGLPEIKAYLNGINLNKIVRLRIVFFKMVGMCFSVAAGMPLGKEGPMIHCGSVVGAALSQGKTFLFGTDISWTKFQDLRNDRMKRDFVTFGAAAGVAAAFSAPVGGVLFTLEEGASFWSNTVTFRSFFCAMMCILTINLIFTSQERATEKAEIGYKDSDQSMFPFGTFVKQEYFVYELLLFVAVGCLGGLLGALYNHINKLTTIFRKQYINSRLWVRLLEVVLISGLFATCAFVAPHIYTVCSPIPEDVYNDPTDPWSANVALLPNLIPLNCPHGYFNQLGTLFLNRGDTALQLMFHLPADSLHSGPLLLFFIPYYLVATIISGGLYPAGLFVPTLVSGGIFGRLIGLGLHLLSPNNFSFPGLYTLMGAAAVMGGMSRLTMAGTVILLEASGNSDLLLPLMLTFAAARYTGNAINLPMYDLQIDLKGLPFLEGHLSNMGMFNFHSVTAIMSQPVKCIFEINKVRHVYKLLKETKHNGFPVISKEGRLRGFILRKQLCTILFLKALASPIQSEFENDYDDNPTNTKKISKSAHVNQNNKRGSFKEKQGHVRLSQPPIIAQDNFEGNYPKYPHIDDIHLTSEEMNMWIDIRSYMDTAPYALNESSSIQRCYRFFRTMGLRHLIILNNEHVVTGILTRHDITEHRLAHECAQENNKFDSITVIDPAFITEREALVQGDSQALDTNRVMDEHQDELATNLTSTADRLSSDVQ